MSGGINEAREIIELASLPGSEETVTVCFELLVVERD